jgi:octanoyl-[GcvH]:protein N-octanoyltransferase
MPDTLLQITEGELSGVASLDTAVSRAILQRVSDGDLPETLQIGRPHRTVAFGKHDSLTDGFDNAIGIAHDLGFDTTIRIAGGRAVVFHRQTIRFAWTTPSTDPVASMHDRFRTVAERVVASLAAHGVSAVIGEVPGEYCPGRYSVHVEHTGKVMGCGQRLARNAAQVGGMIVVKGASIVNEVLVPVYAVLGLDMDPWMTGAIADVADVDIDGLSSEFALQFSGGGKPQWVDVDAETMTLAHRLQPEHDPLILA